MKTETKVITIKEDFMPVDTKTLDSKNRVSLGEKVRKLLLGRMKVDSFEIYIGAEGDLLLRPTVSIPSKEAWIFRNPKVLETIRKGLEDAKKGRIKSVSDLSKFLEAL